MTDFLFVFHVFIDGKRNRNTAVHFHGDSAMGFRHYNHEGKSYLINTLVFWLYF